LLREHPRIDVTLVAQAAPELGEHHFKEVRHGGGGTAWGGRKGWEPARTREERPATARVRARDVPLLGCSPVSLFNLALLHARPSPPLPLCRSGPRSAGTCPPCSLPVARSCTR
jgi:hypothetical protein